ncbi:MAG: metallophosphoesterase [Oscillospiraceae bacterium]|nr:metallophosphoesterase [Oscillospiraceae bacterium]
MNKYIIGTIALGTAAAGWLLWGNSALTKTHITVESTALPRSFDGFRIAHITDLHNTRFAKLPALVTEAKPDIIAITGDLIDARRPGMDAALDTIQQLLHIAPCYYVMGNHESRIPEYPALETALQQLGVYVLRNEAIELERSGEYLTVIGVDDPSISPDFADTVSTLRGSARGFTLLLSHRPERFAAYCSAGIDLALCGHAHGGQVRIPLIGGVIAPHQGFFPEYDSGLYTDGKTNMVLSRGLGNSLCPLRVNNRPELVVVALNSKRL